MPQPLYAFTVLCYIYPLRTKGGRLPVDEVLARPPMHGWLAFNRPRPWGQPETHAILVDPVDKQQERATLSFATVVRIEGGMLIRGQDIHVGGTPSITAQMWAVSITEDDVRALVRSVGRKDDVRRRRMERQRAPG